MTIAIWKFAVCIVAALLTGFLAGQYFGKRQGVVPTEAGVIDFEPGEEEGSLRCVFKLEGDVEWISKQKYIIFRVRS